MSQIELPDPVYGALQQAAQAAGVTPVAWIAARLAEGKTTGQADNSAGKPAKTLAEKLVGRVGRINSGETDLSENCGEKFTDYLEAKKREGRL